MFVTHFWFQGANFDLRSTPICCVCLGDRNDHDNEIVECDKCGVTVHECCYGVNDAASVSSTDSVTPTEPWFCEPCKEGVANPDCELCPNPGGIFKATDVGRWVHLVCALYVPAIAFGEVERLANVTLFEMPYNKWGSKPCGLCPDERLARCGVQIGCDAGMCKQFFHVTWLVEFFFVVVQRRYWYNRRKVVKKFRRMSKMEKKIIEKMVKKS